MVTITFDQYDNELDFIMQIKNPYPDYILSKSDIDKIIEYNNKNDNDEYDLIRFLMWLSETCEKPEKNSENESNLKYINEYLRNNLELVDELEESDNSEDIKELADSGKIEYLEDDEE